MASRTRAEQARLTLRTRDGVALSAQHVRAGRSVDPAELGFVLVHGFTGSWQQPRVRRVVDRLRGFGGVLAIDLRGHGRSGGHSTVGDAEVYDVAAAVEWAREEGRYRKVVTVGFSMGGAIVVRAAALARADEIPGVIDALVSVSAPAFWYYRGTRIMRVVHRLVQTPSGRLVLRATGTRISGRGWPDPPPLSPEAAAGMLGPIPFLIVHGDRDRYFPLEHPIALKRAADAGGTPVELRIVPGFGHAEAAIAVSEIDYIGSWSRECLQLAAG